MRILSCGIVAAVSAITFAQIAPAADMPMKAPAAIAPPFVSSWTGFYVGANVGGLGFTTDGNFPDHPNPGNPPFMWHTDHKEAVLGGLHGGFQGQWGNFVAGIEGGFETLSSGFAQSPGLNGATAPCGYGTGAFCQARINNILSVGPRVGYAINQFLLYGTGGYARYQLETRGVGFPTQGAVFEHVSAYHNGWYLGGGLEMLVTNHVTIGVEYKHYDFGPADNHPQDIPIDTQRVKTIADAAFLRFTIK
jgi:outer membrane immunogenic protein